MNFDFLALSYLKNRGGAQNGHKKHPYKVKSRWETFELMKYKV